jgi:signal transduction histidine kinase
MIARLYTDEAIQRAWLETVLDQMPEGIVIADERGKIVLQNRVALALSRDTGLLDPGGNPVPHDMRDLADVPLRPDELPLHRAVARGESVAGVEFVIVDSAGRSIPVLVNATPVRIESGVAGGILVFQDIRARKELERLREEWASVVAHDLRQPISIISLAASALHRQQRDDPRAGPNIEQIQRAVATLGRMTQDLLDASLIEAQRLELELEQVDLGALIQATCASLVELAEDELDVERDRDLPPVLADAGRVEQILRNLLSNAAKYRAPGTAVRVAARREGAMVEVAVTNRGPGIAAEQLPDLFRRFGRLGRAVARKRGIRGIGLGLYIVKGLVEAHGGRIWAESTPGETTSFRFTLPTFQPADEREAP